MDSNMNGESAADKSYVEVDGACNTESSTEPDYSAVDYTLTSKSKIVSNKSEVYTYCLTSASNSNVETHYANEYLHAKRIKWLHDIIKILAVWIVLLLILAIVFIVLFAVEKNNKDVCLMAANTTASNTQPICETTTYAISETSFASNTQTNNETTTYLHTENPSKTSSPATNCPVCTSTQSAPTASTTADCPECPVCPTTQSAMTTLATSICPVCSTVETPSTTSCPPPTPTTVCPTVPTTTEVRWACPDADLAFVVDVSDAPNLFIDIIKKLVARLSELYTTNSESSDVAIGIFSRLYKLVISFDQSRPWTNVNSSIYSTTDWPPIPSIRDTKLALQSTIEQILNKGTNRPDVPDKVIVIDFGEHSADHLIEDPFTVAQTIRNRPGTTIYGFGAHPIASLRSDDPTEELGQIVNNPDRVKIFSGMNELVDEENIHLLLRILGCSGV